MRASSSTPRLVLLVLPLALAACEPGPGTPVELGALCRAANDGERVAVEGYIDAGSSIFCSNIGGGPVTCGLDLKEQTGDEPTATVYVPEGGGGGEIESVPDDFTRATLRIHADDGTLVGLNDRVRITGPVSVVESSESPVCFVTAEMIAIQYPDR
ncbi:MAG TPA: hypothetical protein VK610_02195 [Rhodothermales bacterium]|nr:hypothetical protein [Rhodothermales bacterium]